MPTIDERKLNRMYREYMKLITGIDVADPKLLTLDPSKITVSDEWDTVCKDAVYQKYKLFHHERVAWGLILISKGPLISPTQKEPVKIEDGCITYADK